MSESPSVPVGATELVDLGGRRLHVWRAGAAGPAVLLVHGIPTNHLLWTDVVVGLQAHARVLAVDMLGYGWSDAPRGAPVDVASQAGYLLRLLDVLGVERCAVVGHDLGGGVAQLLAVTSPHRVLGLAVVNGVCFDAWPVPVVRAMRAAWPLLRAAPPDLLAAGLQRGLRALFARQDAAGAYADRFSEPWRRPDGPRRLTAHLRALDPVYTQALAPFLPRLRMPVEVVWGLQDRQLHPRHGRRLARAIPGAGLTEVGEADHFAPADAPDAVVQAVRRLLERAGAEQGPTGVPERSGGGGGG